MIDRDLKKYRAEVEEEIKQKSSNKNCVKSNFSSQDNEKNLKQLQREKEVLEYMKDDNYHQ